MSFVDAGFEDLEVDFLYFLSLYSRRCDLFSPLEKREPITSPGSRRVQP